MSKLPGNQHLCFFVILLSPREDFADAKDESPREDFADAKDESSREDFADAKDEDLLDDLSEASSLTDILIYI